MPLRNSCHLSKDEYSSLIKLLILLAADEEAEGQTAEHVDEGISVLDPQNKTPLGVYIWHICPCYISAACM